MPFYWDNGAVWEDLVRAFRLVDITREESIPEKRGVG